MTNETFLHFLDQPIEVNFDKPPVHEKSPHCPDGFVWEGQTYRVIENTAHRVADFFSRTTCKKFAFAELPCDKRFKP